MPYKISLLKDTPQFLDACVAWSFSEWGSQVEGCTVEKVCLDYKTRMQDTELPVIWVITDGKKPMGMISLKETAHEKRKDLGPWLGSLFVHPKYRKQGLGEKLCSYAEQEARKRGYEVCYIYSSVAESYWLKCGWEKIGTVTDPMDPNHQAPLMKKTL